MQLENQFTVDAPVAEVWRVFEDIPRVATCLPGAKLTSSSGDEHEGTVTVRLGPMKVTYQGKVTVKELDEASHRARLVGEGRDVRGGGRAQADVQMQATESSDGTATHVAITTDLDITGRVAQFGRGVLQDVSTALVDDFAGRLAREIQGEEEPETTPGAPSAAAASSQQPPRTETAAAAGDDALDAGALVRVVLRRPGVAFALGLVVGWLVGRRPQRD